MKTIEINLYKFAELSSEAKEKAINDLIEFEIETMNEFSEYYKYAEEMDKMKTPWFLGSLIYEKENEFLIATLETNDYDFYENGEIYSNN